MAEWATNVGNVDLASATVASKTASTGTPKVSTSRGTGETGLSLAVLEQIVNNVSFTSIRRRSRLKGLGIEKIPRGHRQVVPSDFGC